MTPDPITEYFEFIAMALTRLGFRGNLLSSTEVYDFLRPLLVQRTFDTGENMYNELWSRCRPAKKTCYYASTLARQLGQILAVDSWMISAKDFPSIEM